MVKSLSPPGCMFMPGMAGIFSFDCFFFAEEGLCSCGIFIPGICWAEDCALALNTNERQNKREKIVRINSSRSIEFLKGGSRGLNAQSQMLWRSRSNEVSDGRRRRAGYFGFGRKAEF